MMLNTTAGLGQRDSAPWQSRRLWSLWVMLKFDAANYYVSVSNMRWIHGVLELGRITHNKDLSSAIEQSTRENLKARLEETLSMMLEVGAKFTAIQVQRTIDFIGDE